MDKNIESVNSVENKRLLCAKSNILIVDGDAERRKAACDILYDYGVSTDEAGEISLAVKLATEHSFDLIFVSEGTGDITGLELVSRITKQSDEEKTGPSIVAFMENLDRDTELEYMRNGFAGVLPLPVNRDMLDRLLEKLVPEGKRQYIDKAPSEGKTDVKIAELFMSEVDVISAVRKNDTIEDYLDLLDLFYTDGLKRVDSLKEKINLQDIQNYVIEVHGLKSSAANIGANTLSELAKQHEAAGNASDFTFIENNKLALFDCYERLLSEIQRVLKKKAFGQFAVQEDSSNSEKAAITDDAILELLKKALGSLESFDSKGAADIVAELLTYSLPETVCEGLGKVQVMLKMYEDDDAEDKLRELIGTFG